jgi:hypothetical protein
MNRGCPDLIRALLARVWQARPVGTKFPYKAKERVVALIHG